MILLGVAANVDISGFGQCSHSIGYIDAASMDGFTLNQYVAKIDANPELQFHGFVGKF